MAFPSVSTFDTSIKGSANREQCKIKNIFYFHCRGAAYLRPQVKGTIKGEKSQFLYEFSK